jgi:hypothetical protein
MRAFPAVAAVLILLGTAADAAPAPAAPVLIRNAGEEAPAALIGTWKLDLAASTYAATPPKAQIRLFDYTADGRIQCHYVQLRADGSQAAAHWIVKLDGSDGVEYMRASGSSLYAVVTMKKVDERTLHFTGRKNGVITETGDFILSADGDTLTFAQQTAAGARTTTVYRRWDMRELAGG